MSSSNADKNLLFGILALRLDFITREQLLVAMRAWMADKSSRLSQILVEHGVLGEEARETLESVVEDHLRVHDNDPGKSLASIGPIGHLREELEQLGDREMETTLGHFSSVQDDGEPDSTTVWVPSSVPPDERFRVLRPHAKGGLGRVSVALDQELHREVAFKELLEHRAHDRDCRSRFVLEAQITGSLEHPGIVPVYGMGRYADGRPFYAMRFIRGENLRRAIDRFHETDVPGRAHAQRTLESRKLLGRFVDVCNAIHYAHSRNVLHRDLKPGNVMLGRFGETLVVDWGFAKTIGQPEEPTESVEPPIRPALGSGSAVTLTGSVVGTPAYMSPEQAEGRVDQLGRESDIYSLGATLYRLLTNRPALEAQYVSDMIIKVQQGDFPRPRAVAPHLPPALEAICLKAMALKPENRYATAGALAEDVEHWLADEPVSAYRETLAERTARWARRHRTWVQAGAAALLLVTVISIAATLLVNAARHRANTLAESNRSLAEKEQAARTEAVLRLREARTAVDTWLTGGSEVLRRYPGLQEERQRLLERAAEDYEKYARQRSDDVDLEIERGRAYTRLGDVRKDIRETNEAEHAYRSAVLLFGRLSQSHPDTPDCRLELANSRTKLGLVLAETGRYAEADEAYKAAISELDNLAKAYPDEPRFRDALGTSLMNRGQLLGVTDSWEEAEDDARRAVREFEVLFQAEPHQPRCAAGLATAEIILARILTNTGRYDEALSDLNRAFSRFDPLVEQDPGTPEYRESRAANRFDNAVVLRRLGRYAEELDAYRDAAADYEALLQDSPKVPLYHEHLALTWTNRGQLLRELGRTAEAETELNRALSRFTGLADGYPLILRYSEGRAACRDALGQVLSDQGRDAEARSAYEMALETYAQLVREYADVPEYKERNAVVRSHLGQALHKLGEHEAARNSYHAAIDLLEPLRQDAPHVPYYQNDLGYVCSHLGVLLRDTEDTSGAENAFRRALEAWQRLVARSPAPEDLQSLAWFLVNCPDPQFRDPKRAVDLAKRARQQAPQNAIYCNTLGVAYYRADNWQDAVDALREAIKLRQQGIGRDWFFLSMAQWRLGETEDAKKSYEAGREWMEEHQPGRLELKRIRDEAAALLGISEENTPPKQ